MSNKVAEIVTEKIMSQLEKGVVPWRRPWDFERGRPRNYVSERAYTGVNVLLLSDSGFGSPYWLTFKQCSDLGGRIRKGEHGKLICFVKRIMVKDKSVESDQDGEIHAEKQIQFLRYYVVFNYEQTEGIKEKPKGTFAPLSGPAEIADNMPNRPVIEHSGSRAFYRRTDDVVRMPVPESFDSPDFYYQTLFHELGHSTGHASRLGRFQDNAPMMFGDETYSREELTAEMAAAMLCAETGIATSTIEQSAAYIGSWLKALKNDRSLVLVAAAAAERAVAYIRNREVAR